jgi:hypothetical protein
MQQVTAHKAQSLPDCINITLGDTPTPTSVHSHSNGDRFYGEDMRRAPETLDGPYVVLIKNRLLANEENDPNKWSIWREIWRCTSFEELARRCPDPVHTSRTGRCITWRTEVRWALRQGWIRKG